MCRTLIRFEGLGETEGEALLIGLLSKEMLCLLLCLEIVRLRIWSLPVTVGWLNKFLTLLREIKFLLLPYLTEFLKLPIRLILLHLLVFSLSRLELSGLSLIFTFKRGIRASAGAAMGSSEQ